MSDNNSEDIIYLEIQNTEPISRASETAYQDQQEEIELINKLDNEINPEKKNKLFKLKILITKINRMMMKLMIMRNMKLKAILNKNKLTKIKILTNNNILIIKLLIIILLINLNNLLNNLSLKKKKMKLLKIKKKKLLKKLIKTEQQRN